jgi:hypothetical protein
MVLDHPALPAELKQTIYARLAVTEAGERKAGDTDEQFFYKVRKKALGMFKRELWGMPDAVRAAIGTSLEERFTFLLTQLNAKGTRAMAEQHAPFVAGSFPTAIETVGAGKGPEDVAGLSD